jgi:hypothetical protein
MLHAINTTSFLLPLYLRHSKKNLLLRSHSDSRRSLTPMGVTGIKPVRYLRDRGYTLLQQTQPRTLRTDPDPT